MTCEQRGEERDKCALDARISFGDFMLDCKVEDISEKGARLRVEAEQEIPREFVLSLPMLTDMSDARRVELRWRYGNAAGVRFRS